MATLFATATAAETPADADACFKRGYAELEAGDVDRAVTDFDQVIQLDPGLALAYFYRGLARFALDANDDAIGDLQTVQKLKPDWTAAKAVMGEMQAIASRRVAPLPDAPSGDAPSRGVGRTHDCYAYFFIFSALMVKTGDVTVRYDVSETGAITAATVQTSSGDTWMDRAAVLCVSRYWRNTPAFRGGVAVASPQHVALLRFVAQ